MRLYTGKRSPGESQKPRSNSRAHSLPATRRMDELPPSDRDQPHCTSGRLSRVYPLAQHVPRHRWRLRGDARRCTASRAVTRNPGPSYATSSQPTQGPAAQQTARRSAFQRAPRATQDTRKGQTAALNTGGALSPTRRLSFQALRCHKSLPLPLRAGDISFALYCPDLRCPPRGNEGMGSQHCPRGARSVPAAAARLSTGSRGGGLSESRPQTQIN